MKQLLYILLLFPVFVLGQSADQNYVWTTVNKVPTTTIPSPTDAQKTQSITYFDGLGRPMQQVAHKQSVTNDDIVTTIEYDAFGRQVKDFLPIVNGQTLNYHGITGTDVIDYYAVAANLASEASSVPFSEKEFENSPLNRVFKQSAPGEPWQMSGGHEIKFDYQSNSTNEVKLYKATATWNATKGLYETLLNNSSGSVYYAANELYKTITKDENWTSGKNNTTEEFKDKESRVVLKRSYADIIQDDTVLILEVQHDTYYVYDDFGNLTYVIPPLVEGAVTEDMLNGLCYQYLYDYRNRLVEKKLPGKDWEFLIYDKLDRLVASGPALSPYTSPTGNGWMITKYDVFNRSVMTAWMPGTTTSAGRKALQDTQNIATVLNEGKTTSNTTVNNVGFRYTTLAWPTSGYHPLTINYFDDYNTGLTFTIAPAYTAIYGQALYSNTAGTMPKGLPTASWIRVPETSLLTTAEKTYFLYDLKGRVVRSFKNNYLGGYVMTDNQMEIITGRVNYTETRHKRVTTDAELYVKESFTYTAQDRLLTHTHKIGTAGVEQLLAKNEYDALGQLKNKQVGGTDTSTYVGLQKVDYTYNIRGWLKSINDVENLSKGNDPIDLFAFKLNYNEVKNETNYTGRKMFNGNIAETYWRTSSDNVQRKYGYFYDGLNRLKNAVYQKPNAAVVVTNSYNENLKYDKNGNITKLERSGEYDDAVYNFSIDELRYIYDPIKKNQLMREIDSTTVGKGFKDGTNTNDDYSYDGYGNMTADHNKGITQILYNHLNLPTKITFSTNGIIEYLYNANGIKLKKIVTVNSSNIFATNYVDGFQYFGDILNFFPTAEGYVKNTPIGTTNNYNYVFNFTDHLGNIRVSYGEDPQIGVLKILEENHYYPFGLKHNNYNSDNYEYGKQFTTVVLKAGGGGGDPILEATQFKKYNYKYNGKEYQDELGLNMYDYGARNYDPAIGRWMNVDPLAEKFYNESTYTYVSNKPISMIDPTGMSGESADHIIVDKNKDGTYTVVGGEANSDRGIYVNDGEGGKGEKIGNMKTTHSFFDEKDTVVSGANINMSSTEGQTFVDNVIKDDPSLLGYMVNATNGEEYDFKAQGIEEKPTGMTEKQYKYRGSVDVNGNVGSARDFGNYGAGLVAARNGLSWETARAGFDTYQGYKSNGFTVLPAPGGKFGGIPTVTVIPVRETTGTVKAQQAGYNTGIRMFKK
ncbi:DUF6443 domain-containing protein [Flavobacterium sp.]